MKRTLSTLLVSLLIVALLSGCANIQIKDSPEIRSNVDAFLAAVLDQNADAAYKAICSDVDRGEFSSAFSRIQEILADVESYELTPIHFNYSSRNGIATTQLTYRMETNSGAFVVVASAMNTKEGLLSFHVTPEEQTTLVYTGTPGHMEGATAVQWIVLVLGFLVWGFVIWVFVDCCRRKIRMKPLWLLLIVFGAVLVTLTISGSAVNFQFNAGIYLTVSSLLRYGDGTHQLRLVIPLGAILYLSMRRKLEKPATPTSPTPAETPSEEKANEE